MAIREVLSLENDNFNSSFFDPDTVRGLLTLFNLYNQGSGWLIISNLVRIIGDMTVVSGLDRSMQVFFEHNGLDKLNHIILCNDKQLATWCLWAASNIACESEDFAQKIVENDLFNTVASKLEQSNSFEIKKEAIIVVGNVLTTISPQLLEPLLDHYQSLLTSYMQGCTMISDVKVINNILDTIEYFGQ